MDFKLSMTFKNTWLLYALITTIFWGVWGAFIEIPEKSGFPPTLGYVVWSLSMIPCAIFALKKVNWSLNTDTRSILLGTTVGLTGSAGQLLLFQALKEGPAYIVFSFHLIVPRMHDPAGVYISPGICKGKTMVGNRAGVDSHFLFILSAGAAYQWRCRHDMDFLFDTRLFNVGSPGVRHEIFK